MNTKKIFAMVAIVMVVAVAVTFSFPADIYGITKGTPNLKWRIVQHRGSYSVSMAYTIEDSKGRLAIIDGGWESDAIYLESIIQKHGNVVDAWIITHPHPDHIGVINHVMANKETNRIRIKKIYTVKVDSAHYQATAKPIDRYDLFEEFQKLTRKEKVIYVKENETHKILGLKMRVLSAWPRNYLRCFNGSVCNCGSMVFKLSGKKRSMLFCGDCKARLQKRIINRHAKELRSTWVQCAHHGRDGFTNSFYKRVHAKGAFIDASDAVIQDRSRNLPAVDLIEYLDKHKTRVFTHATAPNKVIIK